jgi:predicted nucleotide-binding protein
MLGCSLGVAVSEDIEDRDFNPNVALELGFMLGRRKRCLILKEKRLPSMPTDVVGKLYKPFDQFDIDTTIVSQVERWVDVDL